MILLYNEANAYLTLVETMIFQRDCIILHPHPHLQYMRSTTLKTLDIVSLLNLRLSGMGTVVSHCGFNLCVPDESCKALASLTSDVY